MNQKRRRRDTKSNSADQYRTDNHRALGAIANRILYEYLFCTIDYVDKIKNRREELSTNSVTPLLADTTESGVLTVGADRSTMQFTIVSRLDHNSKLVSGGFRNGDCYRNHYDRQLQTPLGRATAVGT